MDVETQNEVLAALEAAIHQARTMTEWAQANGFSAAFISTVRNRKRPPSPRLCEVLGFRVASTLERIKA